MPHGMGNSLTRIRTHDPALETQSLNHGTARQVLICHFWPLPWGFLLGFPRMPALQDCPFSALRPALSGACPPFILRPLQSQGQCHSQPIMQKASQSTSKKREREREREVSGNPGAPTGQGSDVGVGKEVHEEEIQLLACTTRHTGAVTLPPVAQGKGNSVLGYRSRKHQDQPCSAP